MKLPRFTDSQIIAILEQAEPPPPPRNMAMPRTRHEQCHVLYVARQVQQHGGVLDDPRERGGG